jgi:hypothetical protein
MSTEKEYNKNILEVTATDRLKKEIQNIPFK